MYSYAGQILRIDLNRESASKEPLNKEWAQDYFGGKGLGFRYLASMLQDGVPALDPETPFILMTGPLTGTVAPCSGKLAVITKSPATGTVLDCSIGGSFASTLKFAGFDGVVITGKASRPLYLYIKDDVVEFRDASRLWGKMASEAEMEIRRDVGGKPPVLSIGPAGENMISMACITSEFYRQAGRGGVGAVMGSKNLKAIAVKGTNSFTVADMPGFLSYMRELTRDDVLTDDNLWAQTDGTPTLVEASNSAGILPTRNFSEGVFEGFESISSEALKTHRIGKKACYSCPLACGNYVKVNDAVVEGPEYETLGLAGSNCGISDLEAVVAFNALCDDLGLDTMSVGGVIAFAMELTEKDLHNFGMKFGDVDAYLQVPRLIAYREGIGAELGQGVRHLARKYGGDHFAMQVKGLEFPAYEPRGSWAMGLAYATSDRGACHMRAWPVADEAYGDLDPFTIDGKAQLVIDGQHKNSIKFSLILCDFWGSANLEIMAQVMSRALGRPVTAGDLETAAERIWNLGRIMNVREGFTKKDDVLPERIHQDPLPAGTAEGHVITKEDFEKMLAEYYRLRGWNEDGVPSREKLTELGIDEKILP